MVKPSHPTSTNSSNNRTDNRSTLRSNDYAASVTPTPVVSSPVVEIVSSSSIINHTNAAPPTNEEDNLPDGSYLVFSAKHNLVDGRFKYCIVDPSIGQCVAQRRRHGPDSLVKKYRLYKPDDDDE